MARPPDAPVPWQEIGLQNSTNSRRLWFTRQELSGGESAGYAEPALTTGRVFAFERGTAPPLREAKNALPRSRAPPPWGGMDYVTVFVTISGATRCARPAVT